MTLAAKNFSKPKVDGPTTINNVLYCSDPRDGPLAAAAAAAAAVSHVSISHRSVVFMYYYHITII